MEDLTATKFFGFYPDQLYIELYSVGYNEFLKSVTALRERLVQELPDKEGEIELGCSKMLERYSLDFDKEWFAKFLAYCSKNIFQVQPHTPIYKPEMDGVEANRLAHDKSLDLRHCIMATEYLNVQLLGKLKELDAEVERRKELLFKLIQTEQKLELVKRAKELETQLNNVDLPVTPEA